MENLFFGNFTPRFSGARSLSLKLLVLLILTFLSLAIFSPPALQAAHHRRGSWQFTKNKMTTPRREHGIAMLQNGQVLVVGGLNPAPQTSTNLYLPAKNRWVTTGDLNTPRFWFGNLVTLQSGSVLIAGGTDVTGYNDFDTAEIYNPSTGTWHYTQSMLNTARRNATLTELADGRVLLVGGRHGLPDGSGFLSSSEIYDPLLDTWTPTNSSLHIAREGHLAVRLQNGRVLVAGGEGPWFISGNTAELFDPNTSTWTQTGSMSEGWTGGSATLTLLPDGRVLRTGGTDGNGNYYATVQVYNPETGIWTSVKPMHQTRANHSATLLADGRVLVAGGENVQGTLSSSEIYDPLLNKWTRMAKLKAASGRAGHKSIRLANNRVLVVGGWSGSTLNLLASTEIYNNHTIHPHKNLPQVNPLLSLTP